MILRLEACAATVAEAARVAIAATIGAAASAATAATAVTAPVVVAGVAAVAATLPLATRAADAEAIKAKAATCEACHGPQGNPAERSIPSLAGQPKQFITTQLVMYREGRRVNDAMSAIAKDMPNPEINDYGTYFSSQKRIVPAQPSAADRVAAGQKLAQQYNCVQCHGPALMGLQHIPRLAGQQADYLRVQLQGFKAGTRFDMDGNMTAAAQVLKPADIELLAEYLAQIQ